MQKKKLKKRGPPFIFDPKALAKELKIYVDTAIPYPILAEFAVLSNISRDHVYALGKECEELSDAIKKCALAKEYKLEKGMATGAIPPGFGNFALKQLGWHDRTEQTVEHVFPQKIEIEFIPTKKDS